MPHSSGGGSHSSGFHGGSFHSSHSSSGSGSPPPPPIKKRPYAGARHFVYYGRHNRVRHYYYSGTPQKPNIAGVIVIMLFITVFIGTMFASVFSAAVHIPKKLALSSYDSAQIIIDNQTDISDDPALLTALSDFRELTGVTPAVRIVYHSTWRNHYVSLENYAYSEYLRLFDDEKHWLFVISVADDHKTNDYDYDDWSFEGMIGDEAYPAINSDAEYKMTELIWQNLTRINLEQAEFSVAEAVNTFSKTVMDKEIHMGMVALMVLLAAIYALIAGGVINNYYKQKELYNAVPTEGEALKRNCLYCGSEYYLGIDKVCPNCSKPVREYETHE